MIIPVGTKVLLNENAYENWGSLKTYKVKYGIKCGDNSYNVYTEWGKLVYAGWYLSDDEIEYTSDLTAKDWL